MSKRTRACHGFQGAKLVRHLSGHAGRFHHARNVLVFIHTLQKPESFFDSFYYIEAHHILDCTKCCLHAVGMSWQRSLQDISTAASFKELVPARCPFTCSMAGALSGCSCAPPCTRCCHSSRCPACTSLSTHQHHIRQRLFQYCSVSG